MTMWVFRSLRWYSRSGIPWHRRSRCSWFSSRIVSHRQSRRIHYIALLPIRGNQGARSPSRDYRASRRAPRGAFANQPLGRAGCAVHAGPQTGRSVGRWPVPRVCDDWRGALAHVGWGRRARAVGAVGHHIRCCMPRTGILLGSRTCRTVCWILPGSRTFAAT